MSRVTKADLEIRINELEASLRCSFDRILELETENANYLSGNGYVSQVVHDTLIKDFQWAKHMFESYKRLYESADKKRAELQNKVAEMVMDESTSEVESDDLELKDKIAQLRVQGATHREIAQLCDISLYVVNRVIHNSS